MESDHEDDTIQVSHQKLSSLIQSKEDKQMAVWEYLENLVFAPIDDFNPSLEWFNVAQPLSFESHLKGKIVVLDFFTYCCINCMHILPDLKQIEEEFSITDGLVVIGVHSAKFENEKNSSNILAAVQRYNITHPVVNDQNSQMWRSCGVQCWPTLLVLGPNAEPIVMLIGEGHKESLRFYIQTALEYYKERDEISSHEIELNSAFHLLPDFKGPLLFPGKITNTLHDKFGEILAISDNGNNRILIVDTNGTILSQVGSGNVGLKDGSFSQCEFNAPQGLKFLDQDTLYVADTENHAIRKINFLSKTVETVAGNGTQGDDHIGGKVGKLQVISSPWDLCLYDTPDMDLSFYPDGNPPIRNVILIAMAGTHQIWALFLQDTVWWKCTKYSVGTCVAIAGSGREENRNNAYPQSAAFAQPSGLALCPQRKELYIADSEGSTVRRLSLLDGKVTPVVGGDRNPNNLFAFGDMDGVLFQAKLQHVLGLALIRDEETLLVADTYNHKLKKVNIKENSISTMSIAEKFKEPSGLCTSIDGKNVYIADTNNHQIKVGRWCADHTIRSIKRLELSLPQNITETDSIKHKILLRKPITLNKKGARIAFDFGFSYLEDLILTEDAPQKWYCKLPYPTWTSIPNSGTNMHNVKPIIITSGEEEGNLDFVFDIITCTPDFCLPYTFAIRIPIKFSAQSKVNLKKKVYINVSPTTVALL